MDNKLPTLITSHDNVALNYQPIEKSNAEFFTAKEVEFGAECSVAALLATAWCNVLHQCSLLKLWSVGSTWNNGSTIEFESVTLVSSEEFGFSLKNFKHIEFLMSRN